MKTIPTTNQYPSVQAFFTRMRLAWRNILSTILESLKTFQKANSAEAAAGIAYYAFFSLFPLVLLLIVGGSNILQQAVVQDQLITWMHQLIPGSSDFIYQNIQQVLSLRGTFGVVAAVTLLWSASGVFNMIALNINRAFPEAPMRSYVHNRLMALVMVGGLIAISFIAMVFKTLVRLLPEHIPLLGITGWQTSALWNWFTIISPPLLSFLIYWILFWWIPNIGVSKKAALVAAIVTTLIQRLFSMGFSWYLGSGLTRYDMVYGSLSSIVVLLFWIYLTGWITLWGAHFSAAISRRNQQNNNSKKD